MLRKFYLSEARPFLGYHRLEMSFFAHFKQKPMKHKYIKNQQNRGNQSQTFVSQASRFLSLFEYDVNAHFIFVRFLEMSIFLWL